MSNKNKHQLDEFDKQILGHLQEDARITNVALAEAVNLSTAPCLRRVKDLEENGIIKSYVTLLDAEALGLSVSTFIQVKLEVQSDTAMREFEERIENWPEVMECYLMTGDSDYLLRIVTKDLHALQAFTVERLSKIPHIASIRSGISLKQVKYKTALPLSDS